MEEKVASLFEKQYVVTRLEMKIWKFDRATQ